jgi:hypothetical protein
MNSLVLHIAKRRLDWDKVMNALQSAGVVSDNTVNALRVAKADCPKAIAAIEKWLPKYEEKLK